MRTIPALQDPQARAELKKLCERRELDPELIEKLAETLGAYSGKGRKAGINAAFWDLLGSHVEKVQPQDPAA